MELARSVPSPSTPSVSFKFPLPSSTSPLRCGCQFEANAASFLIAHLSENGPTVHQHAVKRMECYKDWYNKYCDCKVKIPSNDIAGPDLWRTTETCTKAQPLFQDPVTLNGNAILPLLAAQPRRP